MGQIERIEELIFRKQEILDLYRETLLPSPYINMNPLIDGCVSGAWMPNLVFNSQLEITREEILEYFRNSNVDARVFFWPISELGLFESAFDNPIARDIAKRSINLPSYHDITRQEITLVCDVVNRIIENKARS